MGNTNSAWRVLLLLLPFTKLINRMEGTQLIATKELHGFMQCFLQAFQQFAITAVASNTATIAIMMNVLNGIITPSLLPTALYASTISCSCYFALPAGTPPECNRLRIDM